VYKRQILNGVFSVVTDLADSAINATATLPVADTYTIVLESTEDGNALTVNGDTVALTYTVGDADTTLAIGTIESRVISAVTGFTLNRTRFFSDASIILDFLINEGTSTALADEIGGYGAVLSGTAPVWATVYIEPSSSLDSQYRSPFNMAMDYHLQDGGEWAIEEESSRERKWYGRGIKMARNIYQNNSTYTPPLGVY
jgi:hypothetical protein